MSGLLGRTKSDLTATIPGRLRLAVGLVFPVLFELRNDPRVKGTPKVQVLVTNLAYLYLEDSR